MSRREFRCGDGVPVDRQDSARTGMVRPRGDSFVRVVNHANDAPHPGPAEEETEPHFASLGAAYLRNVDNYKAERDAGPPSRDTSDRIDTSDPDRWIRTDSGSWAARLGAAWLRNIDAHRTQGGSQ